MNYLVWLQLALAVAQKLKPVVEEVVKIVQGLNTGGPAAAKLALASGLRRFANHVETLDA